MDNPRTMKIIPVVMAAVMILNISAALSLCRAATRSFGVPASGIMDNFEDGSMTDMSNTGFSITSKAIIGTKSITCAANGTAYYTNATLRSITDSVTAGWIRISQGAVSAVIIPDTLLAQPGVGFVSDGGAAAFAVLQTPLNRLAIIQRLVRNGIRSDSIIKQEPVSLTPGYKYKLEFLWSPYANSSIANVYESDGSGWGLSASVVGLISSPNALRPCLFCSNGAARFDSVAYDPNLDNWNYDWEFYTSSILTPQTVTPNYGSNLFANGIHWKSKRDGKFYIRFRNGLIYNSTNVINWNYVGRYMVNTAVSDPCLLDNPFGDGCIYESSSGTDWYKSDGSDNYVTWNVVTTLGKANAGFAAMQDCIDTKKYPGLLDSISFNNQKYRFVGIGEQWFSRAPENGPWSRVKLSNNLSTWVTPDTNVTPMRVAGGWQQIGDAIGCGYPTAEKDILIICCTCTAAGYTGGGFEASNVTSVLDGKQPWVTKKVSHLPMTPAASSGWLKGPNMPNSFVYDSTADVLYFFSDFGDKQQGVARVRNFSHQGVTGTIKSIRNEGANSSGSQRAAFRAIAVMRGNQMVIDMSKIAKGCNVTITISNALGRVFVNRTANSAATITVPANALPKGIYMLRSAFDGHEQVQKFIVGAGR